MGADQEQDCRLRETLRTGSIPVTIVMGSARSDGNTAQTVQAFLSSLALPARLVDLNTLRIHPFEYARPDREDDFRSVVEAMTAADDIVLATPVYWYAMSGTMKVFFDRLTDILGDPIGRKLAGRCVSVLVSGTEEALPPGFHEPFESTAGYFGMSWKGIAYCRSQGGASLSMESLNPAVELAMRLRS
uniref:Flavodoxin family protein n=1 Tax=Bosea sp. NBC_00436 TaxID=2969620 RepID=A0A9E7ZLG6_9HYPH